MAKYIDAEKLLSRIYCKFKSYFPDIYHYKEIYGFVKEDIESKYAVDAVEVVRCKDCKFYHKQECELENPYKTKENDFCSFGKKKEEARDNG